MFAHILLLVTVVSCMVLLVWESLPYRSLVTDKISFSYDYIIVGAGTAGCVLASRLSVDRRVKVLLLESGVEGINRDVVGMPATAFDHHRTNIDWRYMSEPQKTCCQSFENQQVFLPSGRMLGGSDGFSNMIYARGNPQDYDVWASMGATGWSYEDVLPYFIKSENNRNSFFKTSLYHGTDGPVVVDNMASTLLADKFVLAGQELGFEHVDVTAQKQFGVAHTLATVSWGRRWSIANSYLLPAMNRDNLHVAVGAHVNRILVRNREAYGVEFFRNNTLIQVRARKEVIVSAGAVGSPHLLMLSGIGPRRQLESFDVPVHMDLPVGHNLQDHIAVIGLEYLLSHKIGSSEQKSKSLMALFDYFVFGKGMLSSTGYEAVGYFRSRYQPENETHPDIQLLLVTSLYGSALSNDRLKAVRSKLNLNNKVFKDLYGDMLYSEGFSLRPVLLHPQTRGVVRLRSRDPTDHPSIEPNYLAHPDDIKILLEAMQLADNFTRTRVFAELGTRPTGRRHPQCTSGELNSDEYFECFIRHNTMSGYHLAGTCKMGSAGDNTAVVDPQLRVRGVKKLRVIDASVMPRIVSSDPNAAVIMIAEKAADMIQGRVTVRKFGERDPHEVWHEKVHKRDEL